jgi:hypothetical protein
MSTQLAAVSTQLSAVSAEAAALSAPAAAVIPLAHHEKFYALKEDERARVSLLLRMFDEIASAPEGVVAACRRLALENPGRGFSWGTLKNSYYAWVNAGRDWRAITRRYQARKTRPPEFEEFVRLRIEQNKRGARQAIHQIYRDWQEGKSIPGSGTWREFYLAEFPEREVPAQYQVGFYPEGWSQSQLYTLQSSKAERALARRGFAAMKRYIPSVIRDRSGLRRLELIVIDDFETNEIVKAWNPATRRWELCTCTGLVAIDAATGRKLAVGLKPRFKGEEGQRIAITRADVQQLLYSVFSEHGLPRDYGVTILCENAAAAISADFELALETLLGVQVARTGLIADKTLRNGFVEKGGRPWEKGWVESTFNLQQNMAGALPGHKGGTYQLKPGDLEAKLLYAENLLSIEGLTPEQLAQLHVPFWTDAELLTAYEKIFAAMERRTDHRMQGFKEIFDYELPDGSALLPENSPALAALPRETLLACTPVPRRESSLERWERIGADLPLVPVLEAALMLLLLTPKKVTLKNHKLTFEHASQGYTFSDADSPVLALPEGTEVLGYFDAHRPDKLWCTHLDGRVIGPVKRRGAVDLRDRAAIGAEHAEIMRVITKHVLNPVRARHAETDAAQLAADRANLALLQQWNVPAKDIPARLLAPVEKSAATAVQPSGESTAIATAPERINPKRESTAPQSLSAKLARRAPARDAFTAHRDALLRGIAAHETKTMAEADESAVLSGADDLDPTQLL